MSASCQPPWPRIPAEMESLIPMRLSLRAVLLRMAMLPFLATGPALADPRDQDDVRLAVERGEILPLAVILDAVRSQLPGEIVGVEIDQKNGLWLYEFRVLGNQGQLYEVYVDAHSGRIARIKEK